MKWTEIREFKPTILFLVKFAGFYLVCNLLYGVVITAYYPKPDPATRVVTSQTSSVLSACGWDVGTIDNERKPTTSIVYGGKRILAVYEGCNGINTMIIFLAFMVALGPYTRAMAWFIPLGLVAIHLTNLARIGLLFYVSQYQPEFMYFTHKYLFTAILYFVVFLLWVWWVRRSATKHA
jgi:exosortase family protein XrtF